MTVGVVLAAVPNGTLPTPTGPLTRPAPSVAVIVIASPAPAGSVALKLPSGFAEIVIVAAVTALRISNRIGASPVIALLLPLIKAIVGDDDAMLIFVGSMRGGAATFSTTANP